MSICQVRDISSKNEMRDIEKHLVSIGTCHARRRHRTLEDSIQPSPDFELPRWTGTELWSSRLLQVQAHVKIKAKQHFR